MQLRYFILVLNITYFATGNANLSAQNSTKQNAKLDVSCPEIWWGIGHPFISIKAFRISKQALITTRQIEKEKLLQNDWNGGQIDAFKHAFWMGLLTYKINRKQAIKLGIAHEKGNYKNFKKNLRRGRSGNHDKAAQEMDLLNNETGASLAEQFSDADENEFKEIIMDYIQAGRLKIIKKNNLGEYLNENDQIIPTAQLIGIWDNGKVLVDSDYIWK